MLKKFIIKEFSNWHPAEWLWMLFCVAATVIISLKLQSDWFGIAAAVTGVLYSLWAGKGKLSCYFFGIFNSFAYGLISYQATLYGEVALNWFWYFPMMFAGLFFWKKRLPTENFYFIKDRFAPANAIGNNDVYLIVGKQNEVQTEDFIEELQKRLKVSR